MNIIKRVGVWLALMLAIVLIVNAAGTLIVKSQVADVLFSSMLGYSKRANEMIYPVLNTEAGEDEQNGLARLSVRAVLGDERLKTESGFFYNFLFANITVDETNIFFDKDGLNELSSGIFTVVYQDHGKDNDNIRHAVGVISIREFIELDCASKVYGALEKAPDAVIRMDAYTISNYIVHPVSMTLMDADGKELLHTECPYDGELIQASDCFIYNAGMDEECDVESMYHKMSTAYLGERRTDRIADELVDEVNFDQGDYSKDHTSYGLANMTMQHLEVREEGAQITVFHLRYYKGVIVYTVLLGAVMSVIMLIVIRKRS